MIVVGICYNMALLLDKNCSILSAPDNGLLSSSYRGCNQSVHVSCKECYSLQGNETLTCLTSANWSQPVGLCNSKNNSNRKVVAIIVLI